MSDALAAIVAAYRATRRKDWRQLRQVPLVHGIEALTRAGTPFALAAGEADVLRDKVAEFTRRFPAEYEQIRLCGLDYGLNAIIGALATAEPLTHRHGRGTPPRSCATRPSSGKDRPGPPGSAGAAAIGRPASKVGGE